MPGTAADPPVKGKEQIFVRPVAVAGIFRPPEESRPPPAAPEKRRLSAISGDLLPYGDERRRSKEVPFGQALLRRTSRNSNVYNNGDAADKNAQPTTVSDDVRKTAHPVTDNSSNDVQNAAHPVTDKNAISNDIQNAAYKTTDKNAISRDVRNAARPITDKNAISSNDIQNAAHKATDKNAISRDIQSAAHPITDKNVISSNDIQNAAHKTTGKNAISRDVRSAAHPITDKNALSNDVRNSAHPTADKNAISSDIPNATDPSDVMRQPKKVYGLAKRDVQKAPEEGVSRESQPTPEAPKNNKPKVYGVNKTRKEQLDAKPTLETKSGEKITETGVKNKIEDNARGKPLEKPSLVPKISEVKVDNKLATHDVGGVRESIDATKTVNKQPASSHTVPENVSKAGNPSVSDLKVAVKTGDTKNVNKQPASTTPISPENVSKVVHPPAADLKVPLKTGATQSVYKQPAVTPTLPVNGPSTADLKDSPSKGVIQSVHPNKIPANVSPESKTQSVQEHAKGAAETPREFRTLRRTSDVIAAKIQNMFSNFSGPEKPAPSKKSAKSVDGEGEKRQKTLVSESEEKADSARGGKVPTPLEASHHHNDRGEQLTLKADTRPAIEVAAIAPSTVPGTVNVLFRTKSPQSAATKEENRKKVVVETDSGQREDPHSTAKEDLTRCTSQSLPHSTVKEDLTLSATKSSVNLKKEDLTLSASKSSPVNLRKEDLTLSATKSSPVNLRKEDLTLSATKSSPVNLRKEDLTLSANRSLPSEEASSCVQRGPLSVDSTKAASASMPPNIVKVDVEGKRVQKSPTLDSKTEVSRVDAEEKSVPPSTLDSKMDVEERRVEKSLDSKMEVSKMDVRVQKSLDWKMEASRVGVEDKRASTPSVGRVRNKEERFALSALDVPSLGSRVNASDLAEWSRRFESSSPLEPPRAPLRRRAPTPRYGSLPRSPSHSSLPPRYSYTEMLSKVCSLGVLPSPANNCASSPQVSELWSELSEEQSTATHTSEMLESETTERMRLEKEVQELQNRCSQFQLRSDKMEMEMMEARVYRTPELNGDLSEDDDTEGNSSLYKQKYERAVRDMEIMKRRIQQQHEEEMEQKAMLKKASDKRLSEALEDVEEERQVANQWKRKAQKLGSELQDLRLMLEEQMARNGELEKKQRRFDAELSAAQEEIKKERLLREKFSREKEQALHEKYALEQDLQSTRLDADTLHEKITQLNRELDELTLSSKGEEEVTQLKRAKQELERKSRDQEEELEELAAQVSMLEQAKLRLEMSLEKVRQEHRREASVREEEIEEIRATFSKKLKNVEAQLECEQEERHGLLKQKHELERRLYEVVEQPPPQDPEVERRLRRDLKRTKALLRDAQAMLQQNRDGHQSKTLIRQLKNQLEDSEFAKAAAVKARQAVETELHESQTQLEEATRVKNEVESRCLQLSREKSAIQTQLEEAEEEMAEVMKKYKAVVAQMSIDQKTLSEQNQQIADLETEKQMLKDQLSEVSHKFEHLAGQSEDSHKVHRLDGKVRDLESKLELEQTTRSRLEHQMGRLKEQNERGREECEVLRAKEVQAQEGVRRLQRQMRDLREDYATLQQKEAEAYRKQHDLEMALENTETDLQVTKNDLRLACQRIQDLQNALEDDLDSGTDVPDDSGSDSDDSFELSLLRNQSVTPTGRCESAASNYSLASEGFRSRTSSFTHELSAFSRMMLNRRTSLDFLG